MNKFIYLFAMILSLSLWSCGKDDDGVDDPNNPNNPGNPDNVTLELSTKDLVFEAQGGELTFDITCNADWTITNESDWCTLDMTSGKGNATVKVSTGVYEENEDRNTVLTVKAGNTPQTLTVTQKHEDALILSKDKFDVPQAGDNITIELRSNIECALTIPSRFQDWISEAPSGKGMETKTFNLSIKENEAFETREGFVIISGNELKDTVHIFQAQIDQLILMQDTYNVTSEAQNIVVELKTNVDYDITIPNSANSWISLLESKALRTDRLNLSIAANEETDARSALVLIKDKNSDLADTLHIIQAAEGTYAGDVILTTTEEVKAFAATGCKKIDGNLIVDASELTSLSQLNNQLEEIRDSLIINCRTMTNLDGLYGLKKVGGNVNIKDMGSSNPVLEGLNNLETIGGNLDIRVEELTSIKELSKLESIGGSFRVYGGSFTSFEGMENLTNIEGNFEINGDLRSLESFKGLSGLQSIGGNFKVITTNGLNSLVSFEGLENLTNIKGNFEINASVSSYSSDALTSLASFEGLENLASIGGNFEIYASSYSSAALTSLVSFEGLENLVSIGGNFEIYAEAVGSNHDDDYALSSLASFGGLENLASIGGNFEIYHETNGSSYAHALTSLASFEGLENLKSINGNFTNSRRVKIENHLSNLTTVTGNMEININTYEYISINANFSNLESIGGNLSLNGYNDGYGTLSLPLLQATGGGCSFDGFDLIDFPNLESINGALEISYVKNIGTLDKLKSVRDITIRNCSSLYDFCNWVPVLTDYNGMFSVSNCGYNPTKYQILNGECSQTPAN